MWLQEKGWVGWKLPDSGLAGSLADLLMEGVITFDRERLRELRSPHIATVFFILFFFFFSTERPCRSVIVALLDLMILRVPEDRARDQTAFKIYFLQCTADIW